MANIVANLHGKQEIPHDEIDLWKTEI